MTKLTDLLDRVDQLDKIATKAPWTATGNAYGGKVYEPAGYPLPGCTSCGENEATYEGQDAEFIALARTALPQLAKALRAVLEIHKPFHADHYYNGMDGETLHRFVPRCDGCEESGGIEDYPCPTVQAITDALGADDD